MFGIERCTKYFSLQGFGLERAKTLQTHTRLRVEDSLADRFVVLSSTVTRIAEEPMRPKKPEAPNEDLFRSSLEAILSPQHELLLLGKKIDWTGSTTRSALILMNTEAGRAYRPD